MRRKDAAMIAISSGLAFTPLAMVPVYCATKAAIHSLSLTLRFQLRDSRVRVFEAAPPIVATELSGERRRPDGAHHTMSPDQVASGILNALLHDKYEVALGPAVGLHQKREALFTAINQ